MKERKLPSISIVIVSYNCLTVLRACLASVRNAAEGLLATTYVVDNASADGTVDCLTENYPWVHTIPLSNNVGFAKANNVALEQCTSDLVLVLNPDTIIPRGFLREICKHYDGGANKGALGVQMTNGEGHFLRESKRGYPSVVASFYKFTGLWHLAPKSAHFNQYYMGHVGQDDVAKVPVLSGACMAFPRELMAKAGMFDPRYFMYAEDIDLSWTMDQASGGNVYRGDLNIIHFKGMSTPRSMKYIKYFYQTMVQFARKHETKRHNLLVNAVTLLGIYFAYFVAMVKCKVLRRKESNTEQRPIERVRYVSTNFNIDLSEADAVVFDLDGDIDGAIRFMKENASATLFGFRDRLTGISFVYENNAIRII